MYLLVWWGTGMCDIFISLDSIQSTALLTHFRRHSLSGNWMSAAQMAQEFAGLPDKNVQLGHNATAKQMHASMFLPA